MVIDFEIDLVDIDSCVLHRNNHELLALHLKSDMPDIILSLDNLRTNFIVGLMTSFEKSEFNRFQLYTTDEFAIKDVIKPKMY